jgi:hypothetical protein
MAYKAKTLHVDFSGIGEPDYWVEVRHPGWMTTAQKEGYQAEALKAADGDETKAGQVFLSQLILNWNLVDPDTDTLLTLPKDDPDAIRNVPDVMIVHLFERMQEASQVPLGRVNSS